MRRAHLGTGLGAILERSSDGGPGAETGGLSQLLGPARGPRSARIVEMAAEVAVEVMAEAFSAEAIMLANRAPGCEPVVASRHPPSWDDGSGLRFEMAGRLWARLALDAPVPPDVVELGRHVLWVGAHGGPRGSVAVAIATTGVPSPDTQRAMGRMVRSVAGAIGGPADEPGTDPIRVECRRRALPVGVRWSAQVTTTGPGRDRTARADHVDLDVAIAQAALVIADRPAEVSFVGRATVEGASVTVVVLVEPGGAPLVGLGLTGEDDRSGPARAVLGTLDLDPAAQRRP